MSQITKNIGGDRLGSGNKMNVQLHGFNRSTHDLSYKFKSTMAPGTLVPFLKLVCLPGDNHKIKLSADVMTLPTIGPLFGSFKLQLDVFSVPIRLYNSKLHMNELGVGLDMSKVKFPKIKLRANKINTYIQKSVETQQFSQSSLPAYLGIRGIGNNNKCIGLECAMNERVFNAIPFLAYFDIYKNYYANKQEEIGYTISPNMATLNTVSLTTDPNANILADDNQISWLGLDKALIFRGTNLTRSSISLILLDVFNKNKHSSADNKTNWYDNFPQKELSLNTVFEFVYVSDDQTTITCYRPRQEYSMNTSGNPTEHNYNFNFVVNVKAEDKIILSKFNLSDIDEMRKKILTHNSNAPFILNDAKINLYDRLNKVTNNESINKTNLANLAVKTYQSDIFNNWISTEWIDGENGINSIAAIDTSGGSFNVDTFLLAKKVYDMLNRIAISGGSYEDWLQAVYAHEPMRRAESPIYMGGLSKEIYFQEVTSTSDTQMQPLASLAGKGVMGEKNKGGYIDIKVDEPSYIMGIVSITPRIDYSQGFDWDVFLDNMDDLHKPGMDGIGFQDLMTWQMHFTQQQGNENGITEQYSAGKQPAWINYMTNYNKNYGEFANPDSQMFMTLNRRYELNDDLSIRDLTTYIDPQKFNYIFADTRRDAQNFWLLINCDIEARRKMSAKIIPNL